MLVFLTACAVAVSAMRANRVGSEPGFAAHTNSQAERSQAWGWDTAQLPWEGYGAASRVPASPAGRGDTLPPAVLSPVCLVRLLCPKGQESSTPQSASPVQQQLFPSLRMQVSKFLPANSCPLPAEHQAFEGSKCCPAPRVSCQPGEGRQGRLSPTGSHGDSTRQLHAKGTTLSKLCPQTS